MMWVSPEGGTDNTEMRFVPPPEDWAPGCYVKQVCPPHASFSAAYWTRDTDGEANQNAAANESICLQKRNADFNTWCNTDDTQMMWVSPEGALAVTGNLAAQRPVTSSSSLHTNALTNAGGHFDHYPRYAVDGLVAASPIKYHHSNDWATPWFRVDLGQVMDVSSVRITGRSDCCGNWMDGFNILVGCQVCQVGLAVPQGLTGDFVCSPRISGSSVTIVVPGEGRSLVLDEVEVFSDTLHNDTSCYASARYPRMSACGACDGPGPSQCTLCQDPNHAFVPWRRLNGQVSGSCHVFEDSVQYIAIPGQGVPHADELTQFFTKWGEPPQSGAYGDTSFGTWIASDFSITGCEGLPAVPTCRQYKTIECQPADQASNQSRVCETKKESHLVSVDTNILSDWQRTRCELDGGTKSDPHPVTGLSDFCLRIPAASFAQSNWTTLSNVNMLCETQVALL